MLEELAPPLRASLPVNPESSALPSTPSEDSSENRGVADVDQQQQKQQSSSQEPSRSALRQKYVWIRSEQQRQCSRCGSKYHYHWKCPEGRSCVRCSDAGKAARCQIVVQRTQMMRELKDPGELQQLDTIYLSLLQDGHTPSLECYTVYMNGLTASGRIQEAEIVLTEMEDDGVEPDAVAYNVLINAWCSAERMDDAVRVFDQMKRKKRAPVTSTFNTLIKGFGLARQPKRAMELLREMSRSETAKPNARTYNMLINVWSRQKKVEEAKKVIRMMRAAGFSPDVVSYNTLAKLYGELEQPFEAERVIKEMLNAYVRPNERTYAMVITSFCRAGNLDKAVSMIETMRIQGVNPNLPIFKILIKAYAGLLDPAALDKVFQLIETHGLRPDVSTFGVIMNVWCTAGLLDDARAMLLRMKEYDLLPDVIAYATLAKGYARYGRPADAESLLQEMVAQGLNPNVVTYTTVISGWCSVPNMEAAMRVLDNMRRAGVAPNLTTYHTLIWGFNEARQPHKAEAVLDLVRKGGLVPDYKCLELVAQAWWSVGSSSDAQRILGSKSASTSSVEDSSRFFTEAQTEEYDMVSRLITVAGSDWRQSLSVDGLIASPPSSQDEGHQLVLPASSSGVAELGVGMQCCRPREREKSFSVRYALGASSSSWRPLHYLRPGVKLCFRVHDDGPRRSRSDSLPFSNPLQTRPAASHSPGRQVDYFHHHRRLDVILETAKVRRVGCSRASKPESWDSHHHPSCCRRTDCCRGRSHFLVNARQFIPRDGVRCKLRSVTQGPSRPLWKLLSM